MVILIHSSKTMRAAPGEKPLRQPALIRKASELGNYVKTLAPGQLEKSMRISRQMAEKTHGTLQAWQPAGSTPAIDGFIGDIYSGLRAGELSEDERRYADETLRILSGLYGILRPLDGICPYRLEMGYKFPGARFANIYDFWGDSIARQLPPDGPIVNVSSVEYMRAVTPFVSAERIVTPNFLTLDPRTGTPKFTAVHAKIARGAFARWLITAKITNPARLHEFNDLGYRYDAALSTPRQPAFVCKTFGGTGLSIRLKS